MAMESVAVACSSRVAAAAAVAAKKPFPDGRFFLLALFAQDSGAVGAVGHFTASHRAAQQKATTLRRPARLRQSPIVSDRVEESVAGARAARRRDGRQSTQILVARQGSDDGLIEDFFQIALRQCRRLDVGARAQSVSQPDGLQLSYRFLSVPGQLDQHLVPQNR